MKFVPSLAVMTGFRVSRRGWLCEKRYRSSWRRAPSTSVTVMSARQRAWIGHGGVVPKRVQGEQGSCLVITLLFTPFGPHLASMPGPKRETVGTPRPTAMCKTPESPESRTALLAKTAAVSARLVLPAKLIPKPSAIRSPSGASSFPPTTTTGIPAFASFSATALKRSAPQRR